jgi:hypothetical protein
MEVKKLFKRYSFIIFITLLNNWIDKNRSLYHESVKVSIDGLTILVTPKSSLAYDSERELKESRDNKLNEVRRLIELEKSKEKCIFLLLLLN